MIKLWKWIARRKFPVGEQVWGFGERECDERNHQVKAMHGSMDKQHLMMDCQKLMSWKWKMLQKWLERQNIKFFQFETTIIPLIFRSQALNWNYRLRYSGRPLLPEAFRNSARSIKRLEKQMAQRILGLKQSFCRYTLTPTINQSEPLFVLAAWGNHNQIIKSQIQVKYVLPR